MGTVSEKMHIFKFILRIRKIGVFHMSHIFPYPTFLSTKGIHVVGKSLIVNDLITYRRNQGP